ncbi:hypothetical protein FQN52_008171 [Onygenales sp. PD_12]|nr:hypothetical protein FQN52_008171 [Onygenales sp. PD_12]
MAVISTFETVVDNPTILVLVGVASIIIYLIGNAIYNVFFHPLRSFPGPPLYAMSRFPYIYRLSSGTLPFDMLDMHKKYGAIVRIAPDELAFSHPNAWKDIMGTRMRGEEELSKFKLFYRPIDSMPADIISADRDEHSRLRRQLAHGFSEKSMREQEPLIGGSVNLFFQRLHEICAGGSKPLDISMWYNFTTFDVIGDLAFGEPFGCLENSRYDPFIKTILGSAKIGVFLQCAGYFPPVKKLLMSLVPKAALTNMRKSAEDRLRRRMETGKQRPDLIEGLLKKKDEWNMSMQELVGNSTLLLIGGSETTATLLSGLTYLLLTNPDPLAKLIAEVRSTFKSEDEINIISVNSLTYMLACLDEALRMYPPVPNGLPRVVPKGGCHVLGKYIPENTIVSIYQWAAYHNPNHFTDPDTYHPERFLGDVRFATDKREVLQPFHVGPRNCIGRNLAYAEMRLILARLVFNFDLRLAVESTGWMQSQKIFNLWQRGPLKVYLTPVRR